MARQRATVRIGIDVQSIEEVQDSMSFFGERYTQRVFTAHEIESSSGEYSARASSLAGRFAAKEAVLKVLDIEDEVLPLKSIEIRRNDNRRPTIHLQGRAAELARRQGIENLSVSLSHSGGVAAAAVLAEISPRSIWAKR